MRLQVALSHAGIASRRKAALIIEEGRVLVNGKLVCKKGFAVNPDKDEIVVAGKRLRSDSLTIRGFGLALNFPLPLDRGILL